MQTLEPTKRNIIGFASKFYDPLGFLSPVIITLKTFFQELCKSKLDWDDPLPRCYFHSSQSSRECVLYGFCDASTAAYATVVYLCVGSDQAQFMASKTRVAPLSQQTIPRLELLSCLLLARLITNVLAALESVIEVRLGSCFTDSKVALFWIQGEGKEWKPFVHNRVKEIRGLVSAKHWSHCSGKNNPADIPSHGVSPQELEISLLWKHGPDWLSQIVLEATGQEVTMPEECAVEMVKYRHLTHSLLLSNKSGIGDVIDCTQFSKLQKLLRVTVYVKKFVLTFKSLIRGDSISIDWTVIAEDIEEARMDWVTNCQMHMTKEVKFDMWKHQLDLFLDQKKIRRCGGRLRRADIPYSSRHAILLSKQHHLANLITEYAHERTMHGGVKETLTELRSKYWFVRGRQFVRKIIHRCVTCRKVEGLQYRVIPPPPLPEFRVQESPPFAFCGVDFPGSLCVKVEESESSKVWICLYTCCITRAVQC